MGLMEIPLEGMDSDNLERVLRWVRLNKRASEEHHTHASRHRDSILMERYITEIIAMRRMEMAVEHMLNERRSSSGGQARP